MSRCPQCGAEYREGLQECPRCAARLAEEHSGQPRSRLRERLLPFLLRRRDEAKRALGHALQALRVLRRHPSLLLLPLAVAVFNTAELGVGGYLAATRTSYGRQEAAEARASPESDRAPLPATLTVRIALGWTLYPVILAYTFGEPVRGPSATGTTLLARAATWPDPMHHQESPSWWWPIGLFYVVGIPIALLVTAPVASGYYGLLGDAAAERQVEWSRFWRYLRLYYVRFLVFYLLAFGVPGVIQLLLESAVQNVPHWRHAEFLFRLGQWWGMRAIPALVFFLALTRVAIVVDGRSALSAIRRSILTVARGLVTALTLVAVLIPLRAVLITPCLLAQRPNVERYWPGSAGQAISAGALALPEDIVAAVIGTWLCLALFLWYRDAGARRAQEHAGATPGGTLPA
jgi:hypothetical protein